MIRSLRLRFFLIVWPLVVAATVAVGWYLGRWTRVELRRELHVGRAGGLGVAEEVLADSGSALLRRAGTPGELEVGLERLGELASTEGLTIARIVLADADGAVVAAAGPPVEREELAFGPDGSLVYESTRGRGSGERTIRMRVDGVELEVPPGFTFPGLEAGGRTSPAPPLRLYAFPDPESEIARRLAGLEAEEGPGSEGPAGRWRPVEGGEVAFDEHEVARFLDRADRTIVTAVLVASLIAALATFLLARPVVGRAGRLAEAARRIRGGDLEARVPSPSTDELGDVERAFNEMAEELERSEAMKRRLVTDVAHELRTPLTNLVGLLEAVEDGLERPDASTVASLREEVGLLERLVEDLQEIAIVDAGQLGLALEEVDLLEVSVAAREGLAIPAEAAGVEIEIHADGVPARHVSVDERAPPYLVRADRQRLAQVLRNLLANAITHAPEGGAVEVRLQRRGDNLDVAVRDGGPGIPLEHLDLIWERFYRVESSRDRASGGTGLGLAIVKRLVEAQGGRVWAESRPGDGATFHFTLPAA